MTGRADRGQAARERRARLRRGASGELVAAGLLLAKGYRILARRHRTPYGEIDIIAVRRKRIAFVG
jgi:putative endonuclease